MASRLDTGLGLQRSCLVFQIPCLPTEFVFLAQIFKIRSDRLTESDLGTFKGKYVRIMSNAGSSGLA